MLVDEKIVGKGGPGFVVVVDVPYARDAVELGLWDVPVMDDTVVVVLVDDKIVWIGGPGFVVGGVSGPYAGDVVG